MKLRNHAERLNAIEKSEYYLIGLDNVFVSVMVDTMLMILGSEK